MSRSGRTPIRSSDDDMVAIPGARLAIGSAQFYPEEAPVRSAVVRDFCIDRGPVTNLQFARFIRDTGYMTLAERQPDPELFKGVPASDLKPGSMVFMKPRKTRSARELTDWWSFVHGANWRHPQGPNSDSSRLPGHPVVHVAYEDAQAYASWAGKALPTEAEWEHAARGGYVGREYAWGDELAPGGFMMANYWQGEFPQSNTREDGYEGTSPVGHFPPNGYGLYDMIGNVWEWTDDWYADASSAIEEGRGIEAGCCTGLGAYRHVSEEESLDRNFPSIRIPRKVIKGGSHLCAENYCRRYRPAARHPQMIDSSTSHIGFRCVTRHT